MKSIRTAIFTAGIIILSGCNGKTPDKETAFVEDLLKRMTLEEKIGQMNQINWNQNYEHVKKGMVGSVLNVTDMNELIEMQRCAVEESRLGIPVLVSRDVIHGFKTMFPIPLGQAATFNPDIAEKGARVAAIEASSQGIRWTFAPMVDISRDARWGRIAESCGEDQYLTSVMGDAMVKGFQGDDLSSPTSIAACVKHFVGYGAAEGGRDYNSTGLTENMLRNVYLKPFESACKAGAATYMTSFNDNDGIPASANEFILKSVLRNEWGFDGLVVSDWGSVAEMVPHGFATDRKDAARQSVNAGVDMEMESRSYIENIADLINEKKISQKNIDNAVRNILRLKYRLGLFESPYADPELNPSYAAEHLEAAKLAATQSAILLKNNNHTLPLDENKIKSVAIVGPMAHAKHDQMGTWSFDGEKDKTVTPLEAISEMLDGKVKVIYEPGLAFSRDNNTSNIKNAVKAAQQADVTIAFVGEEAILSGEAHSLSNLDMVGAQSELIASLSATGKPVIMVVMAGRPLTIGNDIEKSDAVLYSFHPGTMGGPALADLIFGKAVPSGKTPVTFPKTVGQIPVYYNHNMTGRPAQRNETLMCDIPVEAGQTSLGCTSFYLDSGFDPLYPFGFGLSYTTFEYDGVKIDADQYGKTDVITAVCNVKNTGKYEAEEIVQLYTRDLVGSINRPVRELKGFRRVSLKPGESKEVTFELPVSDLAFWNRNMQFTVEEGEFHLWISPNSKTGTPVSFMVN